MLAYLFPSNDATLGLAKQFRPNDRKLLKFACACRRSATHTKYGWYPDKGWAEWDNDDYTYTGTKVFNPLYFALMWQNVLGDAAELAVQADLLREVVGNPFSPVTKVYTDVTEAAGYWQEFHARKQAVYLAQAAYEERLPDDTLDPFRLSLVADALEEAGCENDKLLRHLRGQEWCWSCMGEDKAWQSCDVCNPDRLSWDLWSGWVKLRSKHHRGCWALDLVLGKE
jgi:hypothetical protein